MKNTMKNNNINKIILSIMAFIVLCSIFITIDFAPTNVASATSQNNVITIVDGMYDDTYTGSDTLLNDSAHTIRDYPSMRDTNVVVSNSVPWNLSVQEDDKSNNCKSMQKGDR